ncbi:MAG: DedA family protein [Methylococcaceae bacterium]
MNEINQLINQSGDWFYLLTFVWAALEGETFVIFAGFAAQRGYLNIEGLCIAAWLGSLTGDQICFWLGRYFGSHILVRYPKLQPKVEHAVGWLEKYAIAFILSYRFMYGIRNVSGIAIGMSHLPWQKFALWNAIAALLWAIAFSSAGYFFGDLFARIPHEEDALVSSMQETTLAIIALIVFIIAVRLFIIKLQNKHLK